LSPRDEAPSAGQGMNEVRLNPPFRADHVGSLIRPPRLIEARKAAAAGTLTLDALRVIEDDCIREAVAMQERIGLQSITDGEMRRRTFRDLFFESVEGFSKERIDNSFTFTEFSGERPKGMPVPVVTGKLKRRKSMTADEFGFTVGLNGRVTKATLPSPGINHVYSGDKSLRGSPYANRKAFFADVVAIYRQEIVDLAARGCTYLQFDETPIAYLCDPNNQAMVRSRDEDPDELINDYIAAINAAVEDRPDDMTVVAHLCRGNSGHGLASGGYDPVAERLFQTMQVDAFFLEYDTDRAGDFRPLRYVPQGKSVVLGLITTKKPELEPANEIKRRIDDAARYLDLSRLCLSPQCGFASNFDMERLTIADQERKLAHIVRIAEDVWG
jgi:5-methyltetrahydropteroyltriglutamate--homocysteine methyltransferase